MKKKIIVAIIILLCISIIIGVVLLFNRTDNKKQEISNNQDTNNVVNNVINDKNENYTNITNIESENKLISNINVIINGKTYNAKIEENETAQSFVNMLPLELNMSELNGNEKYIYLDNSLPTNSYYPKYIEAGDIMLYGNNCLVVFYKSFNTTYSYTKIGHINNLSDLGNRNISIKFE